MIETNESWGIRFSRLSRSRRYTSKRYTMKTLSVIVNARECNVWIVNSSLDAISRAANRVFSPTNLIISSLSVSIVYSRILSLETGIVFQWIVDVWCNVLIVFYFNWYSNVRLESNFKFVKFIFFISYKIFHHYL